VERDELAPVARRCAADSEPDEVDGEEAAAADRRNLDAKTLPNLSDC
jgi:hypothetical protein